MRKTKIKSYILISVLLLLGLTGLVSASANPYEKDLMGVWISNNIDYVSVMNEANVCNFIFNDKAASDPQYSMDADWSAGKKEIFLTIYLEDGDITNRFLYENLTTYNISKKDYTKEDMDKIITEIGHGGYVSINLPEYKDYYTLYTNGNESRIEKVITELEIKVSNKVKIDRKDIVKLKLIESSSKKFDPKKDNTYFMVRIAKSIEDLKNSKNYSVIKLK